MEEYTGFAAVYDMFMDNIPYDRWVAWVAERLKEYGICDGLVLDLGCGTGNMTERLARLGYDMTGVDSSEEMLETAVEKKMESGLDILYLQQDMREFELYGTMRAVVSLCDSLNYITEPEELIQVFRLVNNYLDPGGIFLFDFNTCHKYETLLGEQTIAENREEGSFIWDNYYDSRTRINEYELTFFVREESGLYRKFEELHFQRGYTLEEMKELLEQAGMEFLAAYDAYTPNPAAADSDRICVIARERGKRKTEERT